MKIMKHKMSLIAALALVAAPAAAFNFDLSVVNGGAGPGFADPDADGDRITQDLNQLQFFIGDNNINVEGFGAGAPMLGDTFNFSETGLVNGTTFLPPPQTDGEGFNSLWELNGDFEASGSAEITGIDGALITFALTFNTGSISIFYDEVIDAAISAGAENVYNGALTSGFGIIDFITNGTVDDAGSIDFTFQGGDLLDGFWLDGNGNFLDGLTMALADANVDQISTVLQANGNLSADANSDGSFSVEPQDEQVPEPGTLALLGAGLGLLGLGRIRRRHTRFVGPAASGIA